jgi:hypothetical protein
MNTFQIEKKQTVPMFLGQKKINKMVVLPTSACNHIYTNLPDEKEKSTKDQVIPPIAYEYGVGNERNDLEENIGF